MLHFSHVDCLRFLWFFFLLFLSLSFVFFFRQPNWLFSILKPYDCNRNEPGTDDDDYVDGSNGATWYEFKYFLCQILRVLSPFVLLTQIYCVGHPIYIPVSYYSAPYPNPIKWMEFLSLSGDLLKNYLNIVISVLLVFMIFTWMWMSLLPGLKLWRFKHLMKGTTIAFSLAFFL